MNFNMATLSLYALLEKCSDQKTKAERVEALKYNGTPAVKAIIQYMFHDDVKFLLPETNPPYNPSSFENSARLASDIRKINYFVEGGLEAKQIVRERVFIELLESIDPKDAILLLHLKDKKSPFKGLTKDVAIAAFPELFPT
ncbi:hypothetical protein UFOVP245_147 [uncultured Caudovirales phage]|uniref:Uncharacterized protein n=1 Tax=uncultured Caudovirales phage TaxID=2100421 RepID=A0A6J7WWX9_9CAUD|nr:hypothetical protein UFOVP245_147 [uncultured Caudovirales phage]